MSNPATTEKRAVILLSGGLDSATVLAMARRDGLTCYALSIDYGQRHSAELDAARQVAITGGAVAHKIVSVDLASIGGSALTDTSIGVPTGPTEGIPVTYVPARNTTFLAIALGWAEVLGATEIHLGINAVDYSGYPDCRPEFITAYQRLADVATKAGVEHHGAQIKAPLIDLSKAEIIRAGMALGVDYASTVSCYNLAASGAACGDCDACHLRAEGFTRAGVADPTRYQSRR
ncbi:MAG: 7-cyano-7-deazaguanine synthase QueC [Gammaproteobacteria bacterium]|nr:7-cyano-7-deazaguanine synthase QueC [Gammaproteobacteria bacterium]